ncbi:MAG: response regulator transcription factor [Planctomycetota bacterium]
MAKSRVLLVEDDESLGSQVLGHLRDAGYEADWIRDGSEALGLDPARYDLWILDLMLPGTYGLDVLKHLRASSDVPVLVLSAQDDTRVKVRALQLGGDDYLTKPFWPEELVARVQARIRRPNAVQEGRIQVGGLLLELDARRLTVDGLEAELTRVEFDLLAALARRSGSALARADLAESVLDPAREGTERTLDVHISRLRKKLGPYAGCVATVWGVGYRFDRGAAD